MPRKLRIEEDGGLFHVINRGNYRRKIFEEVGAKQAFERTLFEAADRAGWRLHAFCILNNHFHIAVETPRANLSDGMRWLQSTFAARFNRFRAEAGHLFQGRFKSLIVENSQRMAWLAHYIHLNPARAGLCDVSRLREYRWSSFWHLYRPPERPSFLKLETCLSGAGGLADNHSGRHRYLAYLEWLVADAPMQKEMEFERMSRGWAIGTDAFRKGVVVDERELREVVRRTQVEAKEVRESQWESALERTIRALPMKVLMRTNQTKSANWKIAVAALMKRRHMATNPWLARHLKMGSPFAVSRYVSEMENGVRPGAAAIAAAVTAKVKQ